MLRRTRSSRVVFAKMRSAVLIAGLMTLAIAGCGGDDESPAASGGPGSSGGAQLAGPLTFTRGGGIAGRADKLVVQPDGSVSLTTRSGGERAVKLEPAELQTIADNADSADLAGLPEDSTAGRTPPDAFGYRVVYDGATVTTESGSVPDRMGPLVATLSKIVDRLGAK
jgi:hypothetical protein